MKNPKAWAKFVRAMCHGGQVFYTLRVTQEMIVSETNEGRQEVPGRLQIRGKITMLAIGQMLDLGGEYFILHLQDQRCLAVTATRGDAVSKTWEIVPTDPAGFVAC